ncbi:hypothetical protein L207DRAFT_78884 [Hyaloscypha variabilis F]|uniref:Zn(2)-C6 fungal-type domain-containing protein n=1 Tax=Hyaloscypha variabilis (strain UAMH 11265 / GT02V1 / F) TaxID=1149755 RepID=A0A2J6RGF6_HYAVF|nr:hypothetical protein L207DRAFT_78884 [Hyaloscypha variabilis F]
MHPLLDDDANRSSKDPRPIKFKTRTGCYTCKARRVKCDEQKPSCKRCGRFKTRCGGYPKPRIDSPPRRPLLPKSSDVEVAIRSPITIQRFESEQDLRYFKIFCEQTAGQIAGPFMTGLWNRLMPQASEAVPFVRHAIIAVAALSQITGDADHTLMITSDGEEGKRIRHEHQYALAQYEKALKESLQGRQSPACSLATSGVALFHDWIGKAKPGLTTRASPNENVIENDLVQALAGLDIHVAFFLDTRPLQLHQRIIDDTAVILRTMPASFHTLCEARTYWQMIMRRNFHFRARAQLEGKAAESADFHSGEVPFANLKAPTPEIRETCEQYLSDIYRWTDAAGSWVDPLKQPDPAQRIVAVLLQIHVNMNIITLVGMSFTSEVSFDELLPEFRAITDLAASIIGELLDFSQESAFYRFDLGILPALYLVGTRCRDRVVRGRAIDLMLSSQIREGVWDSFCIGSISNRIRCIEEEGGPPGEDFIPESRRVFVTSVDADCDSYHRRCRIYYTQRSGLRDEELLFGDGLVTW